MLQRPPEAQPSPTPEGGAVQPSLGDAAMNLWANQGLAAQAGFAKREGALGAAFDREGAANKQALDVEQKVAKEQAPFLADEVELAQKYEQDSRTAREQAARAAADQMGRIRMMSDKLANSDATKGFWASQSIGQRIGWAIALGLGAFSQAASRGRITNNGAMEMFKQALQEDAQTKSRMLAEGHDQLANERSALADLRSVSADNAQAIQANYITGLSKIQAQIKNVAAQHSDEAVQAKAAQLIAHTDLLKQQALGQLDQNVQQSSLQTTQGLANAMLTQEQLDFTRQQNEWNRLAKQKGVTNRSSIYGFRPSQNDDDYKELGNLVRQYHVAERQAGALADYFAPKNKEGVRVPRGVSSHATPEDIGMLNHLNALLMLTNLEDFHRGAAVSDQEWQLIKGVTGGDLKWQLSTPGTVARVLDKLVKYRHDAALDFARTSLQAGQNEDPLDPAWLAKSGFDPERQQAMRPTLQKEIAGSN